MLSLLVAAAGIGSGCGNSGEDNNRNTPDCPDGYQPSGPACVPIFDDCTGRAEISTLGGGCEQVGVSACAIGLFTPDGEGGCEPILPPGPDSCPAGTMEVLGQTSCQPVGVSHCGEGFGADGEGGCEPLLPPTACPAGAIAVLGQAACQPLGDCGTTTWGNIVDDPTTVYVDQTADATGADGTQLAPYPTVSDALAVVLPGGQIAIAAGDYLERLNINVELRLTGRCAELVTLRGRVFLGNATAPVTLAFGGTGTALSGVTLTGPGEGVTIDAAQQVTVNSVQVENTGQYGISVTGGAEVKLQRVRLVGCAQAGIYMEASALTLSETVVRDSVGQASDGRFGRGINAGCSPAGSCGSLQVTRSVIEGNHDVGVAIFGLDAALTDTVVRTTQPQQSDSAGGLGIMANCHSSGPCGSLAITGCVIAENRGAGISATGTETTVTDTVVRDTDTFVAFSDGRGINADCSQNGTCGSLEVTDSMIRGNRDGGIVTYGAPLTVLGTIVQDTAPPGGDGSFGRGISAQCDPFTYQCGPLTVRSSLLSRNTDAGLYASGVSTELIDVMVQDTRALADGTGGRGVVAQCFPGQPQCSTLQVTRTVISGNREAGLATTVLETTVTDSVIRDTQARDIDGLRGRGLTATCDADVAPCGSVTVTGSVLSGNVNTGIFSAGVETTVSRTVVRDTDADSSGEFGRGIGVQCFVLGADCGHLFVTDSLVAGNQEIGIFASGVHAELIRTIVRNTRTRPLDGAMGTGLSTQCELDRSACPSLSLEQCLFSGNRDHGIYLLGTTATIRDTVVRDTLPRDDGRFGRGIEAQCEPLLGACGNLELSSGLIQRSEDSGLVLVGVPAQLDGLVVQDTQSNTTGAASGQFGQAIYALCDDTTDSCGSFQMTNSLLDTSTGAGLGVRGISGFVTASAIHNVSPQPAEGAFGFGIQISGRDDQVGPTMVSFNVLDCEILDASLAGIFFYQARGTLSGSVVRGGENSVIMNQGSAPLILNDNELSGTVEDEPTWANLDPAPAPAPSLPHQFTE